MVIGARDRSLIAGVAGETGRGASVLRPEVFL